MAYDADPSATHNPATGGTPTAAWGDILNANFAYLGGAWTSYSPTYTNLTIGNATVVAAYLQVGKTVRYRGSIAHGTTTSVTGEFRVSLPVAPQAASEQIGIARAIDASASSVRTVGLCEISQTTWGTTLHFASDGVGGWTATVPFTWTTSDTITWYIEYEAA